MTETNKRNLVEILSREVEKCFQDLMQTPNKWVSNRSERAKLLEQAISNMRKHIRMERMEQREFLLDMLRLLNKTNLRLEGTGNPSKANAALIEELMHQVDAISKAIDKMDTLQ